MEFYYNILPFLFVTAWKIGITVSARATCHPDKLTVYKVHLQTEWTREAFPKQYPEFRPPAQWSKLLGRTHNSSYVLFRLNEMASDGFKQFAEVGSTELLEEESQGEGGVFDEFNAPPIDKGAGKAETEFFVDGNHSLVSLASRIVPSPDWFIGIDSLDLCINGKWLDSVKLELSPKDAGTDKGFTFTSPNWPTLPKKPISSISAQMPNHPANSFFYPDRIENPPIATLYFLKVKEYELSKVFSPPVAIESKVNLKSGRNVYISDERLPSKNDVLPATSDPRNGVSAYPRDDSESKLITSLVRKYKHKFKKSKKRKKNKSRRYRRPRDCKVSEWSEWSNCSKKCGIGEQIRKRKILKHSKKGGRPCPTLKENKWCGSSRGCGHKYFNW